EVLPLAVPGYSSHQGLAWLRRDLAGLRPDLVTLCYGWNDVDHRSAADREAMPMDALHVASRRLVVHSQALLHLGLLWRHWRQAPVALADRRGAHPAANAPANDLPADALPPEALTAGV